MVPLFLLIFFTLSRMINRKGREKNDIKPDDTKLHR